MSGIFLSSLSPHWIFTPLPINPGFLLHKGGSAPKVTAGMSSFLAPLWGDYGGLLEFLAHYSSGKLIYKANKSESVTIDSFSF